MIIEDSEDDTLLIIRQIKPAGYEIEYERIETGNEMKKALREKEWDLVLSDFKLPRFNGIDALKILNESGIDIPFIIISGTIGEDVAVECMKSGANDYIMKNNLKRLVPAIERELRDAKVRVKQKQAEEALRISEESYRTLIENQGEGVAIVNLKEEFTFVNPAGEKIFGVSPKGLNNKSLIDFVEPKQFKKIQNQTLNRSKGEKNTYELEILRPDKVKRTLLVTGTPKYDKSGDFIGTFGVFRDITDRKQMELAISESERRFKELANLLPQTIFESNIDGIITFANNAGLMTFGYKPEDLTKGLNIIDMIAENDRNAAYKNIKRVFDGLPPIKNEYVMLRKDGSNFPALTFTSAIVHDEKPAGLRGTIVDITNQKQIENDLKKLSEAVEQSPASIVITDIRGNIEYVNKTFSDTTGFSFEEVANKNPRILASGYTPINVYEDLWNSILSGKTWYGEFLNKKKNGDLYWEEAIITPIKDHEETIINFLAVKTDITERKKVEKELELHRNHLQELVNIRTEELNEVNKKLHEEILKQKEAERKVQEALKKEKELNQLKTRFVSIASHEFRTPLSIILSSADLLNRYGNKWEPSLFSQQIERIKKNISRMTNIMDDVLIISRADSGRITFEPSNVNLENICTTIITDMNVLLTKNHNLVFQYMLADRIFLLDEKLLELILSNLLSNAIKYSINGGNIEFMVFAEEGNIVFNISDNGIGIPEKDQFHLFDSFHRAGNVGEVQGTGLGLSIVHRSVKMHGGSIEFSSKEGIGTTFIVKIPILNQGEGFQQ